MISGRNTKTFEETLKFILVKISEKSVKSLHFSYILIRFYSEN